MSELLEFNDPDIPEERLLNNWFSIDYAQQIYEEFLKLDLDRNGMLSRSEIARFRGRTLTNSFLNSLFQNVQLYSGEMVYLFLRRIFCVFWTSPWQWKISQPRRGWVGYLKF